MRVYLSILAGIASAILGWDLGQFFLIDLGWLKWAPELVLFPCVTIALAIGMVLNEIFLSSPTRPRLNLRIAIVPVSIAAGLGLLAGIAAGCLAQLVFIPQIQIPAIIVRTVSWLCIGSSIGLAEGLTWRWRSIEAGDRRRFQQRLKTSLIAGSAAGFAAAVLFEVLRSLIGSLPPALAKAEDPVGFALLGMLLGLALSKASSPSYIAALRAGTGFEYTDYTERPEQPKDFPLIKKPLLKFVSTGDEEQIEEGLSIQFPTTGKIQIGSDRESDIYLPELARETAHIILEARDTKLVPEPNCASFIAVNGNRLRSSKAVPLKHNTVLTFYTQDPTPNGKNFYRFIYYNRFLDPQS